MLFLPQKHTFLALFATFLLISCSAEDSAPNQAEKVPDPAPIADSGMEMATDQPEEDTESAPMGLVAHKAWARPTMTSTQPGAVFLTISNKGGAADQLVGATSERADRVEIHGHKHEDGIVSMFKLDQASIEADGEALFAPGGLHLMLFGVNEPLEEGDQFEVTLQFEQAGAVTINVIVGSVGMKAHPDSAAMPDMQQDKQMHHGH